MTGVQTCALPIYRMGIAQVPLIPHRPRLRRRSITPLFVNLLHTVPYTFLAPGRVGEDILDAPAVGHLVGAQRERDIDDAGHRLDALGIDLGELLDPGEDVVELAGDRLALAFRQGDAGEPGDMRHGGFIDRHVTLSVPGTRRRKPWRPGASGAKTAGKLSSVMTPRKPVESIRDLAAELRPGRRLLGLDVGKKTIGLALSDIGRMIASPRATIRRRRFRDDLAEMKRLIAEQDVGGLVVGLPVNMDGSEGPRCQSVRQFAANLLAEIDLPLAFWDERLSTVAVERAMIDADLSRRRRDRKSTRLNSSHIPLSRMPSSA